MTNEEARDILQEQIDRYGQEYDAEGIEALEMAIKALSSWANYSDELWKKAYVRGYSDAKTLEQQPCEDCISREALMKLFKEYRGDNMEENIYQHFTNITERAEAYIKSFNSNASDIEDFNKLHDLVGACMEYVRYLNKCEREENKMESTNTIKNMIVKPRAKAIEIITEIIERMRRGTTIAGREIGIVAIKAVTGVTEEDSFIDMINFYNDMSAETVATYIYNYAEKVNGKVGEICQN